MNDVDRNRQSGGLPRGASFVCDSRNDENLPLSGFAALRFTLFSAPRNDGG
jgi:hypothetical protein